MHKVLIIDGKQPNAGVGGVSAADFSHLALRYFTAGVVGAEDYLVEAQDTPDMTVAVTAGEAYVPNSAGTMLYPTELDTGANVTIEPNVAGNDRIDVIVIAIDTEATPNEYADNVIEVVAVQGAPASSPSAPTDSEIQTELGAGFAWLKVAEVTVENGASSITNADVSEGRIQTEFSLIGVTPDNVATLTNKRVTKRVGTTTSSATPTPSADDHDVYTVTALAAGATFGAPTGTPTQGQGLIIRVKDNGTARTLAFNAIYRAVGVTLPTTTVVSKTMYLGMIYNATDTKWDVIAVAEEF